MCKQMMRSVAVTGLIAFGLSGCGDHNNYFGSIADDQSTEAKVQEAQIALDHGDCQAAIDGFTAGYNHDPNDVKIRINLAAAYACRAGFNVPALIRVGSDFIASGKTADQFHLFKAISDSAVDFVSASWDPDTTQAISYLTDTSLVPTVGCNPAPFGYDPDAAFNEAIVSTIRAVMAVSSLQDAATDIIAAGSITPLLADIIGSALREADQGIGCANSIIGGSAVVNSDVAVAIHALNQGLNGLDGDLTNPLTASDLEQYLKDQGFTVQ
jgi:hypothetical protein